MEQADQKKLRTAPGKSGAGIRKKDPLELEEFLKSWRSALQRKGKAWEGPRAVGGLRRKEMFEFLLCERKGKYDWQAEDLFSRMLDEMKSYQEEAGSRLVKEYYDDIDEFLKTESNRIKKQEGRESIPELKFFLEDLRENVERTRKTIGRLRKRKRNRHFGVWQQFWPEVPRNNLVSRKVELDTRLQVELGKMLADYLRPEGISLETIARLILLAYWTGGLCGMDGEVIRTTYTGRELKVRNIRENLREIRLHKARNFKKKPK
jgi:hypothetical protein